MSVAQASRGELESLRDLVRSLVLELRETLYQLRVSVSEDANLEEVIRDFARRYEERTKIHVTLTSTVHDTRLPVVVEQELWRITQEALTNVERHARAAEVWITWVISTDRAWLEIRDDGVGFDRRDIRKESFGLTGMRERADAIGAHLQGRQRAGFGNAGARRDGGCGVTTVLLADDHQLLRQALRHALEADGFTVVAEAADGEEAVRLTAERSPDLVVMDVSMPCSTASRRHA